MYGCLNSLHMLPEDLCLKFSSIPGKEYGIWSQVEICCGTRFGPMEYSSSELITKRNFKEEKQETELSDLENNTKGNWLSCINYACSKEQQNLLVFHSQGEIYYITCKHILANTELLVWCDWKSGITRNEHTMNQIAYIEDVEETMLKIDKYDIASNTDCNVPNKNNCHSIVPTNDIHNREIGVNSVVGNHLSFCADQVTSTPNVFVDKLINSIQSCKRLAAMGKLSQNEKYKEASFSSDSRDCNCIVCDVCNGHVIIEPNEASEIDNSFFANNTKYLLRSSRQEYQQDSGYKCFLCATQFTEKNKCELDVGTRLYECVNCSKKYIHSDVLKLCQKIHIGKESYNCNSLVNKFTSNSSHKHQSFCAVEKPYECNICGNKFTNSSYLKIHERIHTGEKPYECTICRKKFIDNSTLKRHERNHGGEKPYECIKCGKKFKEDWSLQRHERSHAMKNECNICGKKFASNSSLKIHLRIHIGKNPYECTVCGKTFIENSYLKKHERIHIGEKPYECTVCGKKFIHSSNLKVHKRTHTGEKPYECNVCGKKFMQSSYFKMHEQFHSGEKPCECNICGKKFTAYSSLKRHEKSHSGERPYECHVCGKKFSDSNYLKIHQRIHTGEKPYECNICGRKFSENGNLRKHKKTHSSERPFECSLCGKKFSENYYLKVHQICHLQKNDRTRKGVNVEKIPCECTLCGRKFPHTSYLKMHERYHTMDKHYDYKKCRKMLVENSNSRNCQALNNTVENTYKCNLCGNAFTNDISLRTHLMTHIQINS